MLLTDFLGQEYGPGDLVIYGAMSGRSVNVVLGRVTDIYRVWHNHNTGRKYGWQRLADDELPPFKTRYSWFDADGNMVDSRPESGGEWREFDSDEREATALRVKVQPLRAARWTQHRDKTYYVDTRTGKRIDPDRGKGLPHVLKEAHYVNAEGVEFDYAGARATWEAQKRYHYQMSESSFEYHYFRKFYHVNYGDPGTFRHALMDAERKLEQLWWVSRQYQPWVEKREEGPKPVTLEITDNIVRWKGELPDEVPDALS